MSLSQALSSITAETREQARARKNGDYIFLAISADARYMRARALMLRVDVSFWREAPECVAHLKSAGFQIAAAHCGSGSIDIAAVDFLRPTAVVLGNELQGVTKPVSTRISSLACYRTVF